MLWIEVKANEWLTCWLLDQPFVGQIRGEMVNSSASCFNDQTELCILGCVYNLSQNSTTFSRERTEREKTTTDDWHVIFATQNNIRLYIFPLTLHTFILKHHNNTHMYSSHDRQLLIDMQHYWIRLLLKKMRKEEYFWVLYRRVLTTCCPHLRLIHTVKEMKVNRRQHPKQCRICTMETRHTRRAGVYGRVLDEHWEGMKERTTEWKSERLNERANDWMKSQNCLQSHTDRDRQTDRLIYSIRPSLNPLVKGILDTPPYDHDGGGGDLNCVATTWKASTRVKTAQPIRSPQTAQPIRSPQTSRKTQSHWIDL